MEWYNRVRYHESLDTDYYLQTKEEEFLRMFYALCEGSENNKKNKYFSFKRNKDLQFFLERLKENAIKKFNSFYNDNYYLDDVLFDKLIFKKEVVIPNKIKVYGENNKEDKTSVIIGSVWSLLSKFSIENKDKKFYKFIMDCGLGEKNSLGFGFINPKKGE